MTPERWRRVGELFDAAVAVEPAGREAWLRAACNGDDDLRAEVGRLLVQDERADRDGLLRPPLVTRPPVSTETWSSGVGTSRSPEPRPPDSARVAPCDDPGGFTPRSAIAPHTARPTIS
jgi:serine/threonine-protein kinase